MSGTSAASKATSEASSLELTLAPATTGAQATAAAAVAGDPIDISTFSLSSSLILGNLATATIKV
jgi:hypothetical protein